MGRHFWLRILGSLSAIAAMVALVVWSDSMVSVSGITDSLKVFAVFWVMIGVGGRLFSDFLHERLKRRVRIYLVNQMSGAGWIGVRAFDAARRQSKSVRRRSEAVNLADASTYQFIGSVFLLVSILAAAIWTDLGLLEEASWYAAGALFVVLSYRGLQYMRIYLGYFGLNQLECMDFYEWLITKSERGDDDFGNKSVEEFKERYLKELAASGNPVFEGAQ